MAQNYKVDFSIKGIESKTAYITVFGDKEAVTIDGLDERSSIALNGGVFTLSGNTTVQSVIRVSFGDRYLMKMVGHGYIPVKSADLWIIISPGLQMSVTGDLTGKDYVDVYATGDPENDMFAELNSKMMPLLNEGANISIKYETDSTLTESDKKVLSDRGEELDRQVAGIRESFVSEHPSCVAALWLMEDMLIRSQIETTTLEPLLARTDAKYHDNYFYKSTLARVEGAKTAAVGALCPSLAGLDRDGQQFDIKDLRGKYVIIDFWGTWCGACLAGMPAMREFRDNNSDVLQIVGVANDKDVEAWKKCMDKNNMDWPNIMQGKGENDFVAKFNVQGFPTKILISPDGKILYRASGESEEFYTTIKNLISK